MQDSTWPKHWLKIEIARIAHWTKLKMYTIHSWNIQHTSYKDELCNTRGQFINIIYKNNCEVFSDKMSTVVGNTEIWGTFRWYGSTLILAWISNPIPSKVWDEITYQFPNFNDCAVDVREWISNWSHTLYWMWLLVRAEIKVKTY